jgi:hypothetical protein
MIIVPALRLGELIEGLGLVTDGVLLQRLTRVVLLDLDEQALEEVLC